MFNSLINISRGAKIASIIVTIVVGLVTTAIWKTGEWWTDKPFFEPYIAVVLAREQIDFGIPAEFQAGFDSNTKNTGDYFVSHDEKKIRIQKLEDFGSIDEANRIANVLLKDENCILVLGSSNSTVTAATLDVFLTSKNPPAYILPIATATNLLSKAHTNGHDAVLRMVPKNEEQATEIQKLALTLYNQPRVAIYGDQENPLYSEDLIRDISSKIREAGGSILVEEMIGPTSSFYNSLPVWDLKRPPQVIIYAGVAHHGFLLIDQLKELEISVPLIFTDGSMISELIENISKIPNKAFVLSPVGNKTQPEVFPTYEAIGKDAYTLLNKFVKSCGDCDRTKMREIVSDAKNKRYLENGAAGDYYFDAFGENSAMPFLVYEITGGKFELKSSFQKE